VYHTLKTNTTVFCHSQDFFQEKDVNGGSKWYLYFPMETFFALKILSFESIFKALVQIILQKFYGNNNFSFCL